ncbi:MAG: adenosine kinase [Verrucomicrobiota bacterium]|nr:adenosine kinase [Verrucomicrobiota bacterium]
MTTRIIDFMGVGSPIIDSLAYISDDFLKTVKGAKGGMELVNSKKMKDIIESLPQKADQAPGGSSANTIIGLANLNTRVSFLGKLGMDVSGEFYKEMFKSIGGRTEQFKFSEEEPSGSCISLITPDSERTMRTNLGAAMTLSPDEISVNDFVDCKHVHVEGYLLFNRDLILKVLKSAKVAECTISLDLASFEVVEASKEILPELLEKYVDIVFSNEEEAAAFVSSKDSYLALDKLSKLCDIAVVKLGKKGAILKRGDEKTSVKAHVMKPVDTTGAGDLWATGFLYGLLNKCSLETCGKMASITSAEVVLVTGGSIPKKTWININNKLKVFLNDKQ